MSSPKTYKTIIENVFNQPEIFRVINMKCFSKNFRALSNFWCRVFCEIIYWIMTAKWRLDVWWDPESVSAFTIRPFWLVCKHVVYTTIVNFQMNIVYRRKKKNRKKKQKKTWIPEVFAIFRKKSSLPSFLLCSSNSSRCSFVICFTLALAWFLVSVFLPLAILCEIQWERYLHLALPAKWYWLRCLNCFGQAA